MHEMVVIAMEGVNAMDLGIPAQVFEEPRDALGNPRYRVRVCTLDGEPVRTNAGFSATVDHDISIVAEADTVIIAAGVGVRQAASGTVPPELAGAILAAHERGARIMAICTGAFLLGALGLLDGRRATTYWRRTDEFRALFPRVLLEPDVLFVDDGILTSAGVAAGLDLCLYVVRKDHGVAAANDVARQVVMPPTRLGGQAQYIKRRTARDDGTLLSGVLDWASSNIDKQISVEQLASRVSMSERSFTRHFRQHTGTSPAAWITTERLARARELLESTDLYVDEVARLSGFGSGTHLRSQFQRRFEQSPTDYRRVFRPEPALQQRLSG